jgi:arginyl-tRNA synthetase
MVIPQEVREIINQLHKKVDQIEEDRMKDKEEAKKCRDQDKEKTKNLEELVEGMVKKMTAWKQELDVFNVGVSDVSPVSDKGVPEQILTYLISCCY